MARVFGGSAPKTFAVGPIAISGFRDFEGVATAMESVLFDIDDCYRTAKAQGAATKGSLKVRIEVGRCGEVLSATAYEGTNGLAEHFTKCVLAAHAELQFPPIVDEHHDVILREHVFP